MKWECGVRFNTVLYDSNMMVNVQFENSMSHYMALTKFVFIM